MPQRDVSSYSVLEQFAQGGSRYSTWRLIWSTAEKGSSSSRSRGADAGAIVAAASGARAPAIGLPAPGVRAAADEAKQRQVVAKMLTQRSPAQFACRSPVLLTPVIHPFPESRPLQLRSATRYAPTPRIWPALVLAYRLEHTRGGTSLSDAHVPHAVERALLRGIANAVSRERPGIGDAARLNGLTGSARTL